jgi:hypothetical protein
MMTGYGATFSMGLEVVVTEDAMVRTWIYPVERFWKYEPSPETEKWCRFFGYGHEECKPGAYQVGNKLLVALLY